MSQVGKVSPALSQLDIRIKGLKVTQDNIRSLEFDMHQHEHTIESIHFDLAELRVDEQFSKNRIEDLLKEARLEGFDDKYLERFMKERHCKLD